MKRLTRGSTIILLLLAALIAACSSAPAQSTGSGDAPPVVPVQSTKSPQDYPPVPKPVAEEPPLSVTSSLRPDATITGKVAEIKARGYIKIGTYTDNYLFSFIDPLKQNTMQGLDVDIARRIAKSIFGDDRPERISWVKVTSKGRIPAVNNGDVDIIIATMTINAPRKEQVDFSEVYLMAGQKVLVRMDSAATGVQDLSGQRVCLSSGSTAHDAFSGKDTPSLNPYVQLVLVDDYTDCLIEFREGRADAIVSDDVILLGLAKQDEYAKIVGDPFTYEPYGIAVSKQYPELTRYVNSVLADMKASGEWKTIYGRWLGILGTVPEPPKGTYID